MKKLNFIRGEGVAACPFGLKVAEACQSVGTTIFGMRALKSLDEKDKQDALERNKVMYMTQKENVRCPYADQIFEDKNKVNCSYGDFAAAEGSPYLEPSSMYPSLFVGNGYGLGSPEYRGTPDRHPVNYDPRLAPYDAPERYVDVPFGLFSLFANQENYTNLLKLAQSTNNHATIEDRLAKLKSKYFETLGSIFPSSLIVKLNDKHLEALLNVIDEWSK